MPAGVLFGTVTFPSGVSVGVAVFGAFGVAGVTTVTLAVLVSCCSGTDMVVVDN